MSRASAFNGKATADVLESFFSVGYDRGADIVETPAVLFCGHRLAIVVRGAPPLRACSHHSWWRVDPGRSWARLARQTLQAYRQLAAFCEQREYIDGMVIVTGLREEEREQVVAFVEALKPHG